MVFLDDPNPAVAGVKPNRGQRFLPRLWFPGWSYANCLQKRGNMQAKMPCTHVSIAKKTKLQWSGVFNRNELGGGQNFWSFMSPNKGCFIAVLRTNFRKISKFGVLCPAIFSKNSPKFPKNFLKFSQFFQNRKKLLFL